MIIKSWPWKNSRYLQIPKPSYQTYRSPSPSTSTKQRWRLWLWGWRLQPTNWWCKPTSSWSQSSPSSLIFSRHPPTQHGKKNISMARTIEFANWRISKNVLVFTKLEESSFYSITCFHQLVTKCWSLGEISSSTFCGRNSQWGFENLDPPKNLHKSLSNPPKKKWSHSNLFWAGIHHDGAVFGLVSGDLC